VISGAASILDVTGRFVKYTLDDDDEVVYIEVNLARAGELKSKTERSLRR
jgi:hypothetical protein